MYQLVSHGVYNEMNDVVVSNYGDMLDSHIFRSATKQSSRLTNTVPNYKALIRAGLPASSEYRRTEQNISMVNDLVSVSMSRSDGLTRSHTINGCIPLAPTQNGLDPDPYSDNVSSDLYNRAMVKFLNKVRSTYESMDGSTFIGELSSTLHGLRHPAQGLRRGIGRYLDTVKKRARGIKKRSTSAQRTRAASDIVTGTYLEYQFGWAPLLQDINSAGRALNAVQDSFQDERVPIHATLGERRSDVSYISTGQSFGNGGLSVLRQRITVDGDASIRVVGLIKRTMLIPRRFDVELGLTPSNFVPAIWNLLPFSFVADYFVNIGDCLSAGGTSTKDLVFVTATKRIKSKKTITAEIDWAGFQNTWVNGYGFTITSRIHAPGSFVNQRFFLQREIVNPNDITVIPVIDLPKFGTRWINMTALGTQALAASRALIGS